MSNSTLKEDGKTIRRLLVKYGYEAILNMIDDKKQIIIALLDRYGDELEDMVDTLHEQLGMDLNSLFQFSFVKFDDVVYIPLNNIVAFLVKIEPYVEDFNLNQMKIKAITIQDGSYYKIDDLVGLLDVLDGYVEKFDLKAVGDYITEKSRSV